ncbi:MAG: hypothetical protein PHT02_00740 [Tissierellia bacterium]|nr:hypothetical protein [Tissierellia bacterium]
MNLKDYYKKTEIENIHNELFKTTTEYQYYLVGIAQGLYCIYSMLNELKSEYPSYTSEELQNIIKIASENDDKIKGYFKRLVDSKLLP